MTERPAIKVLLIEDDPVDQLAFRRMVAEQSLPYLWSIASSVSEAKTLLEGQPFDIVVTDYVLTDGTAFELRDLLAACPTVFTTGSGDEESAVRAMKMGVYDYLVKDPDRNYLKFLPHTISSALQHQETALRLRETEARYRDLADHASDLIQSVRPDGSFNYVNRAWLETLGYDASEVLHLSVFDIVHPDHLEHCRDVFRRVLAGENVGRIDTTFVTRDGRPIAVEGSLSVRTSDGVPMATRSIFRDVTERKAIEERLRQNEVRLREARDAAEAATRAKSSFLANMSHEVRTPIHGILGLCEELLDTALSDRQRATAEAISSNALSLLAILDDILDFSKIEAGRLAIERTRFRLREVALDAVRLLERRALEKGLRVQCRVGEGLPVEWWGDPLRLRQVLLNLVSNAVKFTEVGEVLVEVNSAGHHGRRHELRFSVRDTGIGMEPEFRDKLFQAFSQFDASTTRKYGGTGLGLAISRQLVELMGGTIHAESVPGRGSTFWFTLPLEPAEDEPAALDPGDADLPPARAAELRILIAEDNAVNQMVALSRLKRLGCAAEVVDNGCAAVAAVLAGEFDLVLMDCQMPEMDGFEATARIRAAERGRSRRTAIVAMTASAMEGDRERCLAVGMDDYLSKPVTQETLRAMIGKWAGSARATPALPLPSEEAPFGLDLSRLGELASASRTDPRSLIALYLRETEGQLAELERQLALGNAEAVGRLAHSCVGASLSHRTALSAAAEAGSGESASLAASSLALGIDALVPRFRELEHAAADGAQGDLRGLLARCREGFEHVRQLHSSGAGGF